MGEAGVVYAAGEGRAGATSAVRAPLRASDLAWLAVLPCAAIVLVAIVVLGPSLGSALFPKSSLRFWPEVATFPEPTEHARFLIALTAPLLVAGVVALGTRRLTTAHPRTVEALVHAVQAVALAFVALCVVTQHRYAFAEFGIGHVVYFDSTTLLVAAGIALALAAGLSSERIRWRLRSLFGESRRRQVVGTVVAVVAIAIWLTPALNTESTIVNANPSIVEHMPYWLDEVFAALDGRYPLTGYVAQYGSLWPYPIAGAMALLGATLGVFTVATSIVSAVAMLAAFATMRRLARSTVAAVLLFLPFLATSFFMMRGPLENRYAIGNLFGTFPLRYAGPLLLAWLVTRHLDGAGPRTPRWLFLAAGLTVLNNGDFGVPALAATVAALLWSRRPLRLGRLALEAVTGLAGALVLVSVLTLVTAGSLPHLGLLFRFSGLFAIAGFGMMPMHPTIGVSTIFFLTYVAAIAVATVRAVDGASDRAMTGLLAWSGVFGLGIGAYYMGRSHPEVLTNMFPAWALSVVLFVTLSVRTILARPVRRPSLPEVACLLAFGVLVCSLAQTPTPWSQLRRLGDGGDKLYQRPLGQPFIAAHTRSGESVAILTGLGHRAAYDLHIVDVTPYAGAGSMPTTDQFDEMLDELRAAGGEKVFLNLNEPQWPGIVDALRAHGYDRAAAEAYGMAEYVQPQ